jgi:hypothetical protein
MNYLDGDVSYSIGEYSVLTSNFLANDKGQLGIGSSTTKKVYTPVAVDMSGVLKDKVITKLVAGRKHFMVLTKDYKLIGWGDNAYDSLGAPSSTSPTNIPPDGDLIDKTIVDVATGYSHSIVLTSDNKLYSWGENAYGT